MTRTSRNKVLIISQEFDPHVDYMVGLLEHLGVGCIRWVTSLFPLRSSLSLRISNGSVEGSFRINGKETSLHEIRSVWYRHRAPFVVSPNLSREEKIFAAAEAREAFFGLMQMDDWFWVNHPDKDRIASSKNLSVNKL